MTLSFQRLLILLVSLILFTAAAILILFNSKKNIIFFYTPTELIDSDAKINDDIRIGGFVKDQSLKKSSNSDEKIQFIITDNKNEVYVEYMGILPDLFREKQGVVAEGFLFEKYKINAKRVFAKHDENYMPVSIKKQLEQSEYWKRNYKSNSLPNDYVPDFVSESLRDNNLIITSKDINNKITLINFFASWCLPCRSEHPLLMDLKNKYPDLLILGFNFKDDKNDAIQFLQNFGDPYTFAAIDDGSIGLKFGVFGLPETFLTNEKGQIIFKHTGPLTEAIIKKNIIPILKL